MDTCGPIYFTCSVGPAETEKIVPRRTDDTREGAFWAATYRPSLSRPNFSCSSLSLPLTDPPNAMETEKLADRLSNLASRTEYLANTIYLGEDTPDERMRRDARDLRETLGRALVLAERLAREHGNLHMVTLGERDDGIAEARFEVALEDLEIAGLEMR